MDKKVIKRVIFPLLALSAVMSMPIFAHPGRTDGAGGHTNHSTGEYHYHHGYDDHQHYDMNGDGVEDCPYKFKNNEKQNNSSGGTTTKSDKEKNLAEEKTIEQQKQSSSFSGTNIIETVIAIPLAFILYGPMAIFLLSHIVSLLLWIWRSICDCVRILIKKLKKAWQKRR